MQTTYQIDWNFEAVSRFLLQNQLPKDDVIRRFGTDAMTLGASCQPDVYPIQYPLKSDDDFGGIDVPCLLRCGKAKVKGTIIIIGEAPRRKKSDVKFSLATPYAIQYDGYPWQCDVYKQIFCSLLEDGYDLYLTDAIKVWTNSMQHKRLEVSDADIAALEDEIRGYSPCKIVTFGRVAMDAVSKVDKAITAGAQKCHLYHPSKIAIRHWLNKTSTKDVACVASCLIRGEESVNMFDKEWKYNKSKS